MGFFLFPSVSLVVESRINSLGSQKLLRSDSEFCVRTKNLQNKTRSPKTEPAKRFGGLDVEDSA